MVKLNWDGNDFRNEQSSSGTTADKISHNGNLQQGYNHGSLTKGLVAYYPMEKGEGEVLHDGALDNLGQINGPSWDSTSPVGDNALSFSSGNASIDPTQQINSGESDEKITVSFWFNPDDRTNQRLVGIQDEWEIEYNNNGNNKLMLATFGDNTTSSGDPFPSTGSWYNITVVWDAGTETKYYFDGSLDSTKSTSDTSSNTQNKLYIGDYSGNDNNPPKGDFAEVRIYNRALSQPEIEALANLSRPSGIKVTEKNVPGQDQGGISRYKLNGTVDDSWGSNNGTNNGATFNAGVYGKAAIFNPSESDHIDTAYGNGVNSEQTISAWIKPEDLSSLQGVVAPTDGTSYYIAIYIESDGDIATYAFDGSSSSIASASLTAEGKWYHVTSIRDSDDIIYTYVNGRRKSRTDASSLGSTTNSSDYTIGAETGSKYFYNGKIDDVRIYDQALTPLQVEKLYHKGAYRVPRESTLQ